MAGDVETRVLDSRCTLLALATLALTWGEEIGPITAAVVAVVMGGAVLAAVNHAEVVAARVGEPFGSLVLAVAVTIIEVALIVALRASGGSEAATLARDTVFAAVVITMNGIAGLSLLLGSRRYGVTLFNAEGSGAALATLTTLATLSLVLPTFTNSHPGNEFSPVQLTFAAVASLGLYLLFVFTQTIDPGIVTFSCRSPKRAKKRSRSKTKATQSRPAPDLR